MQAAPQQSPRPRSAPLVNLDVLLGEADDPANPFGHAQALDRDRGGLSLREARSLLVKQRVQLLCWPEERGGELRDLEHALGQMRKVAGRDLSLMSATLMNVSAAFALLVHGSPTQKDIMRRFLEAGEDVGFALSEARTGSDVLSLDAVLTKEGERYRLRADKWLVGQATTARAFLVVARSGRVGPGGFSTVFVTRERLSEHNFMLEGPVSTTGIRGIGFYNLHFRDVLVPQSALLGREGQGLETAFKAQQLVRLLSVAGSLGCMDSGLHATLSFCAERQVQDKPLVMLPAVRDQLARVLVLRTILGTCARVSARAAHILPRELSAFSNVIKWLGTELSEAALDRCGRVLGARSVLDGDLHGALLDKARRDNLVIRFFDTSTLGVLRGLSAHLSALARMHVVDGAAGERRARLRAVFQLDAPLPPLDYGSLELFTKGCDLVAEATLYVLPGLSVDAPEELRALLVDVQQRMRTLLERAAAGSGDRGQAEQHLFAEQYCLLHAATVCALVWHENPIADSPEREAPMPAGVLASCLRVLVGLHDLRNPSGADASLEAMFARSLERHGRSQP